MYFPIQRLTEYQAIVYLGNIVFQVRSQCSSLRSELEHKNTYTKILEETLKSQNQGNDVTDQSQTQDEMKIMGTGVSDKQRDEDISEVRIFLC